MKSALFHNSDLTFVKKSYSYVYIVIMFIWGFACMINGCYGSHIISESLGRKEENEKTKFRETSLLKILQNIYTHEVEGGCTLKIVYEEFYANVNPLQVLINLPTLKQIFRLDPSNGIEKWGYPFTVNGCEVFFILLFDFVQFYEFTINNTAWDIEGRYVVVSEEMKGISFFLTRSTRTLSENILFIVPSYSKEKWVIYARDSLSTNGFRVINTIKLSQEKHIFKDKIEDFGRSVLKVVTFELAPAVIYHQVEDQVYRYGRDIELVKALAKKLNFQISFLEPARNEFWGHLMENGSYNGMLGMIIREEADIGVGNNYLGRGNEHIDFTVTYDYTSVCFLGPVAQPVLRWHSLLRPFMINLWVIFMVMLIFCITLLYFFGVVNSRLHPYELKSLPKYLLITLRLHFHEQSDIKLKEPSLKIFCTCLSIYCLIITIAYSSNLIAFLTVPYQPKSINTIAELLDFGLTINEVIPYYSCFMATAADPKLQKLSKRVKTYDNFSSAMTDVSLNKAVLIENKPYEEYVAAISSAIIGGPRKFRIMKECITNNQIVIYLSSHSSLKNSLDETLNRFIEAGLINKWFLDSITLSKQFHKKLEKEEIEDSKDGNEPPLSLKLDQLQGIFFILVIGNLFALLVFGLETAHTRLLYTIRSLCTLSKSSKKCIK